MTSDGVFLPLDELTFPGNLPIGSLLDDVLQHIWITAPTYDAANKIMDETLDEEDLPF